LDEQVRHISGSFEHPVALELLHQLHQAAQHLGGEAG